MPNNRLQQRGEPPCDHWDDLAGTVGAGNFPDGPHLSVATCRACRFKSAAYVSLATGLPANDFLSYEEARAQSRSAVQL